MHADVGEIFKKTNTLKEHKCQLIKRFLMRLIKFSKKPTIKNTAGPEDAVISAGACQMRITCP